MCVCQSVLTSTLAKLRKKDAHEVFAEPVSVEAVRDCIRALLRA